MTKRDITRTIIITENKSAPEWTDSRFSAEDDLYGICGHGADKETCINFVKGALLYALVHSYADNSVVPDQITITFEVIEK